MVENEKKDFIKKIFMKIGVQKEIDSCLIGEGYTGSVWKISDDFCLKVSTKNCLIEIPENFKKSKNLCVPLKTVKSKSGKYVGHILKYCNLYSLEYLIKNEITLPEKWVAHILNDMLNGVKILHENGYVHRDFHPGNIMLTKNNNRINTSIIDFDDMQPISPKTKVCFQYNGYQAPEIVYNNAIYDDKSEMFTFGVILWELLLGKCPFGGHIFFGTVIEESWDEYMNNSIFYNERVKWALKSLPQYMKRNMNISEECFDFMNLLLNFNKEKRLSAKEALQHPFMVKNLNNSYIGFEEFNSYIEKCLEKSDAR